MVISTDCFTPLWSLLDGRFPEPLSTSSTSGIWGEKRIPAFEDVASSEKKGTTKSTKKSFSFPLWPSCSSWFKAFMLFATPSDHVDNLPDDVSQKHQ